MSNENIQNLTPEEIETVDRALARLRPALAAQPHNPIREEAAVALRRAGFTGPQIVTLSRQRWPRASVNRWIRGIGASEGAPAERAVQFLDQALDQNVTLANIFEGLGVLTTLASENVTVQEILNIVAGVRQDHITLRQLVDHYRLMTATGLTFPQVREHLTYRRSLEDNGFGLDSLRLISEAARRFNNRPDTVLEAINTYENLLALTRARDATRTSNQNEQTRRDNLNTTVTALEQRQTALQHQINSNQETIRQLEQVTALGYNQESLRSLEAQTRKFGGPGKLFDAITKYGNLTELEAAVSERTKTIEQLKADKTKLEADNIQYKTAIEVTLKLITDHKLGLDALQELLGLCEKHGAPEDVLRAVHDYDNLKTLEDEVASRKKEIADLEKKKKDTLEDIKNSVEELVKDAIEAGKAEEKFRLGMAACAPYLELLNLVTNPQQLTNPRIVRTVEAILRQLKEWLSANRDAFTKTTDITYSINPEIDRLVTHLAALELSGNTSK
jgi:predicted  nucleic acid-binding Zn-ribbon protein